MAREINRAKAEGNDNQHDLASLLRYLGGIIGLLQDNPETYLKSQVSPDGTISDHEVNALIEARRQAREHKDWARADQIRDQLTVAGIELEDGVDGSRWRRK